MLDIAYYNFCEDNDLDAETDEAAEAWEEERLALSDERDYFRSLAD